MRSAVVGEDRHPASVSHSITHGLSSQQFSSFWENGFLGPLACGDPNIHELPRLLYCAGLRTHGTDEPIPEPASWNSTPARLINLHDPHRHVPEIMAICAHPSIVNRVAKLLKCPQVAFFQSRFRVKFPQKEDPVPWHQDIGQNSGGYRADGSPVPSITVWLSVDGANEQSGSLQLIPGTHTKLFGNWRSGFNSRLEESGAIAGAETSQLVPVETNPGEFYLLHSWTLHRSVANLSASPRSALVLRFVAPDDMVLPRSEYAIFSVNGA